MTTKDVGPAGVAYSQEHIVDLARDLINSGECSTSIRLMVRLRDAGVQIGTVGIEELIIPALEEEGLVAGSQPSTIDERRTAKEKGRFAPKNHYKFRPNGHNMIGDSLISGVHNSRLCVFKTNIPKYAGQKKVVYVKTPDERVLLFDSVFRVGDSNGLHIDLLAHVLQSRNIEPSYEPGPDGRQPRPIGEGYELIGAGYARVPLSRLYIGISGDTSMAYPDHRLERCFPQLKADLGSVSWEARLEI